MLGSDFGKMSYFILIKHRFQIENAAKDYKAIATKKNEEKSTNEKSTQTEARHGGSFWYEG